MSTLSYAGQLVSIAVETRENGDPDRAILFFRRAYQLSDNSLEKAEIMSEMGLCYFHLGNYDQAEKLFLSAIEDLCQHGDVIGVARVKCEYASLLLKLEDIEGALSLATKAREAVVILGIKPVDLCHLTHVVIKALFAKRKAEGPENWVKNSKEIKKMIDLEAVEVKDMMKKEKSFRKYVWQTGYLGDLFLLNPAIYFAAGMRGYLIAKKHGLNIRMNQAQKALGL